jgi:hypothetical protein
MWKSVFYKEWLKTRWFVLAYILIGMLFFGYLFLMLKRSFAFNGGRNVWFGALFQGVQFFSLLKFIPLAGGFLVAISQYLPEATDKRLKLTFHLPMPENRALLAMQVFGIASLLVSFTIFSGLFLAINLTYFPVQMAMVNLNTVFPWFLAGFAAYFLASLVIVEPGRTARFLYSIISFFFLSTYFVSATAGVYTEVNSVFAMLTILLSCGLMFSAYRFKKGGI